MFWEDNNLRINDLIASTSVLITCSIGIKKNLLYTNIQLVLFVYNKYTVSFIGI